MQIPDPSALELLRELLVLVYVWNKALPQPILAVTGVLRCWGSYPVLHLMPELLISTDGALCLLFKGLTKYMQAPSAPLPEELQSGEIHAYHARHKPVIEVYSGAFGTVELSSNIPAEKHPALLTLTKAAHLQSKLMC